MNNALIRSFNIFISVFMFLMFFPSISFSDDIQYWQQKLSQAQKFMNTGNYKEALEVFQNIAENTASSFAEFQIGWIYQNGFGVKPSCQEAARWYTHSANQGSSPSLNNLYTIYYDGCPDLASNRKLALQYLEKSAQLGNSRAQSNLSRIYRDGKDVEANPYQAYDLAKKSADQGDITGLMALSDYYSKGLGVPVNLQKSFDFLNRAATIEVENFDLGNRQEARFLLAKMFHDGTGTPPNNAIAYKWLLLAVSGPNKMLSEQAKKYLAELEPKLSNNERETASIQAQTDDNKASIATNKDLLLALNQAIERNSTENAIDLAKLLASQNNSRAQLILGSMFYQGYGSIKKDIDEAYVLFKISCQGGEWESCLNQVSILADHNNKKDALDLISKVMKSFPKTDEARIATAKVMIKLDNFVVAEYLVRESLLNNPLNKEAKILLDSIQAKLKRSSSIKTPKVATPIPKSTKEDFIKSGISSCVSKMYEDPLSKAFSDIQINEYCDCAMNKAAEFITIDDLVTMLQNNSNKELEPIMEASSNYCVQVLTKKWSKKINEQKKVRKISL
ncbi:MAG: tetratricopeptide repeat protein [Proteobacteria bacterium]|nr:tetratricopeptide repeat protein [Pseudomonadota bacterium]